VPSCDHGELLLSGPQVTLGYLNDPEKTSAAFVLPPGADSMHYRTGDLVRRPEDGLPLTYLGRVDHQIKVHGHRVELGEVEAAVRATTGEEAVVALGWPRNESAASGIVAFVGAEAVDASSVRKQLAARLPDYMVPWEIRTLRQLPLNDNGKFDRGALLALLEADE